MIWINKFIYWCPINIVSNRIHKNRDMKKKLVFLVWLWGIACLAFGREEFEKKVFRTASGDELKTNRQVRNIRWLSSCTEQGNEVRITKSSCFMEARCGSIQRTVRNIPLMSCSRNVRKTIIGHI